MRPPGVGREAPLVVEIAEGAVFIAHPDEKRPLEGDAAGETFAKRAEADGEVGDHLAFALGAHPGAEAPGQELGIFADIGDEIENLLRPIADHPALGMGRHRASPRGLQRGLRRGFRRARRGGRRNRRRRDRNSGSAARRRPWRTPGRGRAPRIRRIPRGARNDRRRRA